MPRINKPHDESRALWRASAYEAVPYTDDFPEVLLTLPELTDGSIGKGDASRIEITFDITNPEDIVIYHQDNGRGISMADIPRLFNWANAQSASSEHRYGQGSKKFLSKAEREYNNAKWELQFKMDGQLKSIQSPWADFKSMLEATESIEHTEANQDIGFKWTIHTDNNNFGNKSEIYKQIPNLFSALKEIITSRYHADQFDKREFVLTVRSGEECITESSRTHSWKTLEQMLTESPNVKPVYKISFQWKSTTVSYNEFTVLREDAGITKAFPTYGVRSMEASRCHIANDGRFIEPKKFAEILQKKVHNSDNDRKAFINVRSTTSESYNDQPVPCTTKVSFQNDCPNLNGIFEIIRNERKRIDKETKPKVQKKKKTEAVAESAVAKSAVAESAVAESAVAESAVAESAVANSSNGSDHTSEKKPKKSKISLQEVIKRHIENMTDDEKATWMVDTLQFALTFMGDESQQAFKSSLPK